MILDYYKVLGVGAGASPAEIKRAYRRLARQYHPDLHAQEEDEQIKRLNEAYEVLSNARKRAAYDQLWYEARRRAAEIRAERERQRREQEQALARAREEQREPEMTWVQGIFGFVRELKKGLRDD